MRRGPAQGCDALTMATRVGGRTPSRSNRGAGKRGRKAASPSAIDYLKRIPQSARPHLGRSSLPSLNRDVVGALTGLLCLISVWAILAGDRSGILIEAVDHGLARLFGRAQYGDAILSGLAAYRCFRARQGRVLFTGHALGGAAFAISVAGLTHAAAIGARSERGGVFGEAVLV